MPQHWRGWNVALKPSYEPVIVAMNPLDGTFAQNALKHGVAGINVDGCRVGTDEMLGRPQCDQHFFAGLANNEWNDNSTGKGRWPANLIHDGSEEVVGLFPVTKPARANAQSDQREHARNEIYGDGKGWGRHDPSNSHSDSGSAARFFYCAKASRRERDAGLPDGERCTHPTVKPLALTEYLAKLILPPEQDEPRRLFVPFAGSGSEMIGAHKAGWDEVIGVELEREYVEIARARLEHWAMQAEQMVLV